MFDLHDSDLLRYFELSVYIEEFEVDKELLEKALKKFLILPPIFSSDLQTLIFVLKLLSFALKKRVLINQFYWVADMLMNSELMHHNIVNNFKNDKISIQLCNQFLVELYQVYWLCLKNFSHFSTISLTKLLFDQLSSTKNELVLLQVNLKCLSVLTENSKNIDYELVQVYLSQLNSLKTILMSNSVEKSLQQSYLTVLNHILHHTILVPKVYREWGVYDWETWTWSMIHSTDPLVRALVFQFSAGLSVIDVPMSYNLIQLALNYFCELNCVESCIVAEQATIFCSNIFCNPKFKTLSHQYIIKLNLNAFINIINTCSFYNCTKPEKKYFSTSPKLVANICCMLLNMITLAEFDLCGFDQNCQFVHALSMCLKKYLTPICIEKPNILEMCGRICSVLALFVPYSSYNFENVLTYLNAIFDGITTNLDHCTTMVWRSVFKMTVKVIQFTNCKLYMITNNVALALIKSVTSENNDLCIDALNVISISCSQLSKKLAYNICSVLTDILHSQWQNKLKRKMLLIALSNILLEHPYAYETTKQKNLICFLTSKLKIMQLQIAKQSIQKSKTLQNDYLEIVGFCCNIFYGCIRARKDASAELPDLIHKFWPIIVTNPKSDLLICTLQMLVSFTSNCPTACSAMTMTSNTVGVDPKTKSTSCSLFHEVVSVSSDIHLTGDVLDIALILVSNCCQAQECRVIITKSKLLLNISSILNLKDKKRCVKIEQKCLDFLLVYTSFNEGQRSLLKVDYILDTLIDLLKSNYKNDSIAILRNLCFNTQNRVHLLSSDIFLNGIKTLLESGNLSNQLYKDVSLAVWSVACNNQKARLQLRHWGIDKYFEKSSDVLGCDDETRNVIYRTFQILKN